MFWELHCAFADPPKSDVFDAKGRLSCKSPGHHLLGQSASLADDHACRAQKAAPWSCWLTMR